MQFLQTISQTLNGFLSPAAQIAVGGTAALLGARARGRMGRHLTIGGSILLGFGLIGTLGGRGLGGNR